MKLLKFLEPKKPKSGASQGKVIYLNDLWDTFSLTKSDTFTKEAPGFEFEMEFELGRLASSTFRGSVNLRLYIIDTETKREYKLTQKEITSIFELVNFCVLHGEPLKAVFKIDQSLHIRYVRRS